MNNPFAFLIFNIPVVFIVIVFIFKINPIIFYF